MRILVIDTAAEEPTILLLEQQEEKARMTLTEKRQEAAQVLPTIEKMLKNVGWTWTHISRIGVVRGPGSFTSVRIGVMVAAAAAYALNREIVSCTAGEVIDAGGLASVPWESFAPEESITPLYNNPPRITLNKKMAKLAALKKK